MEVFEAISDPVRREILVGLAQSELSAGEIAGRFTISRPAVSRHLRLLREAGLVRDDLSGRRRIYRLTPDGLEPLQGWLAALAAPQSAALAAPQSAALAAPQSAGPWSARFDALDTEVRRTRRDRSRSSETPAEPPQTQPERPRTPTRETA